MTVSGGEVDAVLAAEDRDKVLVVRLAGLVSTAELAILLLAAGPVGSVDTPLEIITEFEGESVAESSVDLEESPVLGNEGPETTALEGGPLGNDDSVYGPAVDDVSAKDRLTLTVVVSVLNGPGATGLAITELGPDDEEYNTVGDDSRVDTTGVRVVRKLLLVTKVVPMETTVADESGALLGTADEELAGPIERLVYVLDTMDDELNVQVSTSVVVKSVTWEVERFVATVVTMLVVIVKGRPGVGIAGLELSTDSNELGPKEEATAELGFTDGGTSDIVMVEEAGPEDDV